MKDSRHEFGRDIRAGAANRTGWGSNVSGGKTSLSL
jgi:hypothetical protein